MKNDKHFIWTEAYRPRTIEDCILPQTTKDQLLAFVKQGNIPHCMFAGTPGIGKTTVAMALCEELGVDFMMLNASKERGIDEIKYKVTQYASTVAFNGGRKVIILDEADSLTADAQKALRGVIEEFSKNCSFIFTCNFKSKLIEAIHSRCTTIEFRIKNTDKAKIAMGFMKRVQEILTLEGVTFENAVLAEVIGKYFPDFRRTLNELQRYATSGAIDTGLLPQIQEASLDDLMGFIKFKKFTEMRKWVVQNIEHDPQRIFRRIYDALYSYLDPNSIPLVVLIIAKYQFQHGFAADAEINLVACLTEIMMEAEFK